MSTLGAGSVERTPACRRIAWWHCFAGIAGDMAMGSLVDAGADLASVERELAGLEVGGWALEAEQVQRGGLAATKVHVRVSSQGSQSEAERTYAHIVGLLNEARLPERARQRSLAVFERLAQVEGRLHRRSIEEVHFHEVGSVDAIIDVVGTCVALEVLDVDEVQASPVALGSGLARGSHGLLPVPAPAVAELLRGAPVYGSAQPFEMTTPTGAAILAALAGGWGPVPAMEMVASGFGAGSREIDGMPNVLQVVLGRQDTGRGQGTGSGQGAGRGQGARDSRQVVVQIEANLDDVTGEVLGHAVSALLAAGAYDAWVVPAVGKKGRPAQVLSALGDPARADALGEVIATETGSLGVRFKSMDRWVAGRRIEEVEVEGHRVRVKLGSAGSVKAEFDDVASVAAATGLVVREVAWQAEEEARRLLRP